MPIEFHTSNDCEQAKPEPSFIKIPDSVPIFRNNNYTDVRYHVLRTNEREKNIFTERDKKEVRTWTTKSFSLLDKLFLETKDPRDFTIAIFWKNGNSGDFIKDCLCINTCDLQDHLEKHKFPKTINDTNFFDDFTYEEENQIVTVEAGDYFDYNVWIKNPRNQWCIDLAYDNDKNALSTTKDLFKVRLLPKILDQIKLFPNPELENFEVTITRSSLKINYYICRKHSELKTLANKEEIIQKIELLDFIK